MESSSASMKKWVKEPSPDPWQSRQLFEWVKEPSPDPTEHHVVDARIAFLSALSWHINMQGYTTLNCYF